MKKIYFILIFFFLASCGTLKRTTEKTVSNTDIKTEATSQEKTEVKKDSTTTKTKTLAVSDKSETPLLKDTAGQVQDVHFSKKVGEITVSYGIRNGKLYSDVYIPESESINTNVETSTDTAKEASLKYTSITDQYFESTIKKIRGVGKWKLYFIIFLMLLFIFRKQALWLLSRLFPGAKFIIWLTKFLAPVSVDQQQKTNTTNEINDTFQNNKITSLQNDMNELKAMIKQIKPELFAS